MTKQAVLVQKHRANMAEEGNARMEVTLGRGLISQARDLAKQKRCPLWEVVEQALLAYVATGNGK
jgi:hypothetical protein